MDKFVEQIIDGRWQFLINIPRFQTHLMNNRLSVAEHTWLSGMLAMQILDNVFPYDDNGKVSTQIRNNELFNAVQRKILLHDIEETETGDIPLNSNFRQHTKSFKNIVGSDIVINLFPLDKNFEYVAIWKQSKIGLSGLIVAYCDMLSALIEALMEKKLGNILMDDVVSHAMSYLQDIVAVGAKDCEVEYKDRGKLFIDWADKFNSAIIQGIGLKYGLKPAVQEGPIVV